MSIFRNHYQIRHVVNDLQSKTTWESVVLGVFSPSGKMPKFFGIEMRYEVGDISVGEIQVDGRGELHLTTNHLFFLTHAEVHELASYGIIQLDKGRDGFVQLLSAKLPA